MAEGSLSYRANACGVTGLGDVFGWTCDRLEREAEAEAGFGMEEEDECASSCVPCVWLSGDALDRISLEDSLEILRTSLAHPCDDPEERRARGGEVDRLSGPPSDMMSSTRWVRDLVRPRGTMSSSGVLNGSVISASCDETVLSGISLRVTGGVDGYDCCSTSSIGSSSNASFS
jgi:hypothetical protein